LGTGDERQADRQTDRQVPRTSQHTHPPKKKTKKGERIKRVYEATGVTKIDVTDQGVVRIAGPTNGAVLRAREMLELVQVGVLGGWVGWWWVAVLVGLVGGAWRRAGGNWGGWGGNRLTVSIT
jgi:polyribonucleotide nucleotidyltransferase